MRSSFSGRRRHRHPFERGFDTSFEPGQARGRPPFPPMPPPFPPTPGWEMPWDRPGRGRGHGPGGRRGRRGDVRAAIVKLLAERPMHGYEMIQEIGDRSGGLWRPSPGSIYPTLQLLADEGLITSNDAGGSKRLFELTEDGRAAIDENATPPWEQFAQDVDPDDVNLRSATGLLMGALFQVQHAASSNQKTRAIDVINEARREIYAILGEVEPPVE
jgi:DNA-binding PadR family transcriptional regulator